MRAIFTRTSIYRKASHWKWENSYALRWILWKMFIRLSIETSPAKFEAYFLRENESVVTLYFIRSVRSQKLSFYIAECEKMGHKDGEEKSSSRMLGGTRKKIHNFPYHFRYTVWASSFFRFVSNAREFCFTSYRKWIPVPWWLQVSDILAVIYYKPCLMRI